MIWSRQSIYCLVAGVAVLSTQAQNLPFSPGKVPVVSPVLMPPSPQALSPVAFFRNLLAMSPKERSELLTNRAPEIRARIFVKIHEYEALDPDERELRLRATELRWYLMPLLQVKPANRADQLAQVPEDLRDLVKSRLTQWDILPPPLKEEFLKNDQALHYFVRIEPPGYSVTDGLPDSQGQKVSQQFSKFFELTAAEKQETLSTLSAAERTQMAKTLRAFDQLPSEQRMQCVHNYAKFAGLSAAERSEFLKNAERWSQMSPTERQAWRDLVAHVPQWPPLPPTIFPPMPPTSPRLNMATN